MSQYGLKRYTLLPSVYGESNFRFLDQTRSNPITMVDSENDCHVATTKEARLHTINGRAVIVFFKGSAELEKHLTTSYRAAKREAGSGWTIFQSPGKLHLACGREQFPPKLIGLRKYAVDKSHELEIDAMLHHLFRHVHRFLTSSPFRLTSDLLWLPSDVKRTTVNRFLAFTAISVQKLHQFCCSLRQGPLWCTHKYCDTPP